MTGWQGNEGDQGGWQQPPNPHGGDPYAGAQYGPSGTDPYDSGQYDSGQYENGQYDPVQYDSGQYPVDPYQQGGYGQDQYQQDPYGQQTQYGAYAQYPQTHGFPAQDFGPPEPPQRSRLPMIFGVLAIVIIVGAVVTIVLINRNGNATTAGSPDTTSEPPPSSPSLASSSGNEESPSPAPKDGWQTVDNSADADLTYQVPGDWKLASRQFDSGLGVQFTGAAQAGPYDCQGSKYVRSFATSGDVQAKNGKDLDLKHTVNDFAKSFAGSYFGSTPRVDLTAPRESQVSGKKAVTLHAAVTQRVTKPKCQATKGDVAIVGVRIKEEGKPAGVAMLVVVSDVQGGPASPKPLPASVADDILATVQAG